MRSGLFARLLAFGFLGSRQRRLRKQFQRAYTAALESRDMHERIVSAETAHQIAAELSPWPWPDALLTRRRAIGKLHGALGRACGALISENPLYYSRRSLEEYLRALEYLTPEDKDWALTMNNLSIAYAERVEGAHGDNIERAIETVETVLGAVDREREREQWINAMANLAGYLQERRSHSRSENIERAIQAYEVLMAEVSQDGPPALYASLLVGLGSALIERRMYDREGNVEKAIEHLEAALRIVSRETSPMDWAMAQSNLSIAYDERIQDDRPKNVRRAIEANDRCLEAFQRLGAGGHWARALMVRHRLFKSCPYGRRSLNLLEAIESCERALTVFTAEDYPEDHASAVRALHETLAMQQGSDRKEILEEVIERGERMLEQHTGPKQGSYADNLVRLGNAYAERMGGVRSENQERSIELLEEAVTLLDQRADPLSWGGAMHNLAQSYQERTWGLRADNVEKSLALCEAALVVVSNATHPREHSELLETLGEGFFNRVRGDRQDNLRKALEIFSAASRQRRREDDPEAWLRLEQKHLHAGRVSASMAGSAAAGQPRRDAEEYLAELRASAELVSSDEHPRTWMAAHLSLADAYTQIAPQGIDDSIDALPRAFCASCRKALEIYEAMLPVAVRLGDQNQWALLQDRIGVAYGLMNVFTHVLRDIAQDAESQLDCAEEALRCYTASVAAHAAAMQVNTIEKSPRNHLRSAVYLGRLHTFERDWIAAEERFASAARAADELLALIELSDSEAKNVLEDLGSMASLAPFTSLMLGKPEQAIALAEAGRARLLAKALTLEALPLAPKIRDQLHGLQRDVALCERKLVSPRLFDRRTPLDASIGLRGQIRSLIQRADVPAHLAQLDVRSVLAELTDGGAVLVMPVLTEAGGRIILGLSRQEQLEIHGVECTAADELKAIFETYGSQLGADLRRRYLRHLVARMPDDILADVGDALGKAFAEPLVQALDRLGVGPGTHLDILPQGPLGILPLGLARDGHSGQSLLERYEISFCPSLTALRQARRRGSEIPRSLVTVANPDRTLPFAEIESALVDRWFGPMDIQRFVAQPVDQATLLAALPDTDVWHFATHAEFDLSVPGRSRLALGDEFLSLETILETSGLGAPRLVVLSACESGLYDLDSFPHELIGLPTGFLQAGAAGVIGTLWPVEDLSTTLLVGRFFDNYLGRRLTPAAALRSAQLWLRDASRDEIYAELSTQRPPRDVSLEYAMSTLDAMAGDAPFAAPVHWSGFVHYGV